MRYPPLWYALVCDLVLVGLAVYAPQVWWVLIIAGLPTAMAVGQARQFAESCLFKERTSAPSGDTP